MKPNVHVRFHNRNVAVPARALARKSQGQIEELAAPVHFDPVKRVWFVRMPKHTGAMNSTNRITMADILRYDSEGKSGHMTENGNGIARLGAIRAPVEILDDIVLHMKKQVGI